MLNEQMRPVNPDLFLEAFLSTGEWLETPVACANKKKKKPGIYMTDVPMNRVMLGLMNFCKRNKVSQDSRMSFGMRFLSFGDVFDDDRSSSFIHEDTVHESLVRAIAIAQYCPSTGFDKNDVFKIAEENRRIGAS